MISIAISCEESELQSVQTLLSGFAKPTVLEVREVEPPAKAEEPTTPPEKEIVWIAEPEKAEPKPAPVIRLQKAPLTEEQKTTIKKLHEKGKSLDEIKAALGITDGRQIFGVLRMAEMHAKPPSIEADIKKLHGIGCSNREIKSRLGMENAKLIRQVVKSEVQKDIAKEQRQDTKMDLPLKTVRRILALDEEKMIPATISDVLEEEFGLVVSVSEIMDVITKHAKGML